MFNYDQAFRRNIGWVSKEEQKVISNTTIAVGGLGGVGGDEIIGLARMGFQKFHIADLDHFDLSNFNRQAGATVDTIGRAKATVISEQLKSINPNIELKVFADGINDSNVDLFLDGVDVYVDSLDLFALHARSLVFERAYDKGIPALTAAPLSMGVSFLCFMPGGMRFREYFGFTWPSEQELNEVADKPNERMKLFIKCYGENVIRFLAGVAPKAIQRKYLMIRDAVNIFSKDVPSLKPGIDLAAGTMCTNVLKIVLGRGEVIVAPKSFHFDAYLNVFYKVYRIGGKLNPLFHLTQFIIKKVVNFESKMEQAFQIIDSHEFDEKAEINDKNLYSLISQVK
jgi:molybdopterin/thiamine biosynthesis adenylyltransferase